MTRVVVLCAVLLALLPAVAEAEPAATQFPVGPGSAGLGPITLGPDDNLWFTEFSRDQVGRMTPGGTYTPFPAASAPGAGPRAIDVGPDGSLWFGEYNTSKLGRLTTAGAVSHFSPPGPGLCAQCITDLTTGSDAGLWVGRSFSEIFRFDSAGAQTNMFDLITPNRIVFDVTLGPDGNVWFAAGDRVGKITPAGVITEYTAGLGPGADMARAITAGPDGNLWYTVDAGRIGRITPGGSFTEFSAGITPGSAPFAIAAAADGNLWFTELSSGLIGRITPSGAVTEFSFGLPANNAPMGIVAGPGRTVWFTSNVNNTVVRISIDGLPLPPPAPPPPAVVPPPPPPPSRPGPPAVRRRAVRCVVPSLKGKTVTAARRALRRANCRLGRVKRARGTGRRARVRVASQQYRRGQRLRAGRTVDVTVKRVRRLPEPLALPPPFAR